MKVEQQNKQMVIRFLEPGQPLIVTVQQWIRSNTLNSFASLKLPPQE